MKDFSQTKATLTVLEAVQELLKDMKERAEEREAREEEIASKYRKITDEDGNTTYYRRFTDDEGQTGEEQVDRWSYNYAMEALQDAMREVQAIVEVEDHMDKFKF